MGSSIRPEPPKKKRGAFTDLAEQLAAPQAVAADAMEGKPAPAGAFSDLASQMQYTPSQPDGFTVGDAAKMAGQGAAFGWGDELAAAMQAGDQSPSGYARLFSGVVKAFKGDPAYTQAHESNEAELSRIREANPKSAMAAEIGGGVATSLAGAGILKAMGILPAAEATVAGRIAQGAKIGAAQGAIAGAGNASEGNRTLGAGLGAGAGAIVGGAVPAIGEGVKRAGGFAADALKLRVPSTVSGEAPSWLQRALQKAPGSPLPGVQSVDDRAVDLTRRTATKGGKQTVSELEQQLDGIPIEVPVTITDDALGGRPTQMLARGARAMGESGREEIDTALEARQRDAAQRLVTTLQKATGVAPDADVDEVLASQAVRRGKRAKAAYDAAYASPDLASAEVAQAFKSPAVRKAFDRASTLASIDEGGLPAIAEGGAIPVRTLDQTKKFLDRIVRKGAESEDGISRDEARRILNVLKPAMDAAKAEAPAYKKALRQFAEDMTPDNAIALASKGDKRLKLPPFVQANDQQVARAMAKLDDTGRQMYRLAVVQDARQKLMARGPERDAVVALLEPSPLNQAKWKALLGSEDAAKQLFDAVGQERSFRKAFGTITGGSQTDANLAAQDLLTENVGETVIDAVRRPGAAMAQQVGRLVQGRLRGVSRATADALAPRLVAGSQGGQMGREELKKLLAELMQAETMRPSPRVPLGIPAQVVGGAMGKGTKP